MQFDPSTGELHNLVLRNGKLRTRYGLQSVRTNTAGSLMVAAFTVNSPTTTEPFHYIWEVSTTTTILTLRVFNEEYAQVYTLDFGQVKTRPFITYGITLNQIIINGPFGAYYGIVGGGLIQAIRVVDIVPSTTTIDPPSGIVCSWGDRLPIANANTVYFNDSPTPDVRAYAGLNITSPGGEIYDMFAGPDNSLWIFTSTDTFNIPQDALGQSQTIQGFISTVPGLTPSRSGNACQSNGVVACLSKAGLVTIAGGVQTPMQLSTYDGKRSLSVPVNMDDWRDGQLFKTSNGFLLSFASKRKHCMLIDLRNGFNSFLWNSSGSALDVVGVLRGRGGTDLYVTSTNVLMPLGNVDWDGSVVRGVACSRVDVPPDQQLVVRSVTVKADNISQNVSAFVGASTKVAANPAHTPRDTTIGISTWAASGSIGARELRTTRLQCNERLTDLSLEVSIDGGNRALSLADIETRQQGVGRRDNR